MLSVTAARHTLPLSTQVQVAHGGGCERFVLGTGEVEPCTVEDQTGILFCAPSWQLGSSSDASPGVDSDAGPERFATRLRCELWTDGAATVALQALPYYEAEQHELQAEADECGITTVDVPLVLGETDAGP